MKATINKIIKKRLIATSIILSIATTPVMASSTIEDNDLSRDSSSEIIGFSTGAIIGGLIAGPIGIVAAGTIGLIIGQSHQQKEHISATERHLQKNKVALQALSNDKLSLLNQLAQSEQNTQQLSQQLTLAQNTLDQADTLQKIKLNLRFDVDSTQVESFYKPQIKHLAMMMQANPELSVNLSGFADASGDEESNLKLSRARTQSVKSMLVKQGVNETHIFMQSFGESTAVQTARSETSDFNNRRVEVELLTQELTAYQQSLPTPEQNVAQEQMIEQVQIIADIN